MWVKALGEYFSLPPRDQTLKNQIYILDRDRISYHAVARLAFWLCGVWFILCLFHFCLSDFLLEEISRNHEVSRIKSIGGAAQVRFASVCPKISAEIAHHVTSFPARPRLVEISSGSQLSLP
jgi:hypothetical protein